MDLQNKDWLFSGLGIVLLGGTLRFIRKKNSDKKVQQKIESGNQSNNIQGGEDVRVTIGGRKDDE